MTEHTVQCNGYFEITVPAVGKKLHAYKKSRINTKERVCERADEIFR